QVEGIRIYGPQQADIRGGAIAFNLDGLHAHDVAAILDREGIAIRAGHHCAMPLHQKMGVTATARASFYIYNEPAEIDRLVEALDMVRRLFER
ncbi:MAG: aminotransferase class V-fold PLP-dependent enzyme, partial [Anaerolineae bacterium]|nr:aminotransferase class V-fold PLP-dependent enzyme [Anaerolineae bacterium]